MAAADRSPPSGALPSRAGLRVVTKDAAVRSDERTLVNLIAGGDREAFETLYRLHSRQVFTYLLYNVPTSHDAEEITQEVFLSAWRKIHQYRGDAALRTWLMSIAVRKCRMWYRSGRRRGLGRTISVECIERASPPAAVSREEIMDLRQAIAKLPRRARTVLVLHELNGHRHEEIAAIMGTTVGTSKAHLSRARRLLREELGIE